ncbi:MAG: S8 family serine peptidase [Acidobacteriota bacterium]
MTQFLVRLSAIILFIFAIILANFSLVQSDTAKTASTKIVATDHTYRSRAPFHKILINKSQEALKQSALASGGELVADYGEFMLMKAPTEATENMAIESETPVVRDDLNLITLRAATFDTTQNPQQALRIQSEAEVAEDGLFLVQMVGPVKADWFDLLDSTTEVISYVPNNAYLIRANSEQMAQVKTLATATNSFIQWIGDYKPGYKVAPELALDSEQEVYATVQLVNSNKLEKQIRKLAALANIEQEVEGAKNLANLRVKIRASKIAEVARLSDVTWIEPYNKPELFDERQGLIVSGNLLTTSQLANPGYLNWLRSKNLASTPDFLVDIVDSGFDKGILDPDAMHQDFLNQAGASRVLYSRLMGYVGLEGTSQDGTGHGTINASIVGGYNVGTGAQYTDANGYAYGLGIHPFIRLGATKIFDPDFTNPNYVEITDAMYRDNARISSNSWGAYGNAYSVDCQTYDSLVRDARRTIDGNQELTIVFAAGNRGPDGPLSTPGIAKNVITVGASENLREGTDGCRIETDGADDALSLIDFSSGGRTFEGRVKPDITAPGTHIQGAASQYRGYLGGGVCNRYYPNSQTLYTWSSGTSHACPAVSGGAALLRQFFQQSTGKAPSPAMIKAYLTNSTTYMTGEMANDSLPGFHQGWGLMNLGRALDETQRILIDQSETFADTGNVKVVRGRVANPGKAFRVTLAWTDAPGNPAANPVVNNLDLQVIINGQTYYGNHFNGAVSTTGGAADLVNNLESVWLPEGTTGEFEVRVIATNIAGDGVTGNGDGTDQDFALVIYNVQTQSGGGGGSVDAPPFVNLLTPVGGETFQAGNVVQISWDASDDKAIKNQFVEFSSNNGSTYDVIAALDGNTRSFNWKVPALPTDNGKIRVTALDGVNLPATTVNFVSFKIVPGPPDLTAPDLVVLSPTGSSVIGGGTKAIIKWRESDNVGVVRRVLEYSLDNGNAFQAIADIAAPSSGDLHFYEWQVPVSLNTERGRIRISVFDGAGNMTAKMSEGKFSSWPQPIITEVEFITPAEGKSTMEVNGRAFRKDDTLIFADDLKLKKISFDKCDAADGSCKKIIIADPKLLKRFPEGKFVNLSARIGTTGQVSPLFEFKRKRPKS